MQPTRSYPHTWTYSAQKLAPALLNLLRLRAYIPAQAPTLALRPLRPPLR